MAYNYNGKEPNKIPLKYLTEKHKKLIFENNTFCMYPWIHLNVNPNGKIYPCCAVKQANDVGSLHNNTLEEIWNDVPLREVRKKMLEGKPVSGCENCYEQEKNGFFSMRVSINKHFGHHIKLVDKTMPDGTLPEMKLIYWDVRFSNLCNLRCRSCGHLYSSNWYDDQIKLAGSDYAKDNKRIFYAGKSETDTWEQMIPHIDYVEQVYFAGGEPLIMEEHYKLLKELIKRKKTNVRLIYNSNFNQLTYKKTNVLEIWREFESVCVGASLDGMHKHAEYIRKGTNWNQVEKNREEMLKICPNVDFYISPTLSIMNALHLPYFHKDWVNKGFLQPQDCNVNILQNPPHYRIDVLPVQYKKQVKELYQNHLEWLKPLDKLKRATVGFESAINFMIAEDKSNLLEIFKQKTAQLDKIRNENILDAIPELGDLYE